MQTEVRAPSTDADQSSIDINALKVDDWSAIVALVHVTCCRRPCSTTNMVMAKYIASLVGRFQ